MRRYLLFSCLLWCGGSMAGSAAASTTVYQCRAASGQMTYQDLPCSTAQDQRLLALPELPRSTTMGAPPTVHPAAATTEATTEAPSAAPGAETFASVPQMYGCVRATDGKPYVSRHGEPAPYLAPYGMLGAGQLSLSDAYGPTQGGAGISAPEANRGRVTTGLVADNYVWVQDQCRELSQQEVCAALREDFDQNAHALKKAFKSDRPPLEKRDGELRAQLQSC